MRIPRYPLKREDVCRVAGEHAGNQVDNRLCTGALEPPARDALLAVAATAELGSTRLLRARLARAVIDSRREASVYVELSPALRAVEHTCKPVGRLCHGPPAL